MHGCGLVIDLPRLHTGSPGSFGSALPPPVLVPWVPVVPDTSTAAGAKALDDWLAVGPGGELFCRLLG